MTNRSSRRFNFTRWIDASLAVIRIDLGYRRLGASDRRLTSRQRTGSWEYKRGGRYTVREVDVDVSSCDVPARRSSLP